MKTILVLFPKEGTSDKVVAMLRQNRYPNVQKVTGVQQAVRLMNRLSGGVLITGHRLQGMGFEKLLDITPKWFDVLLILGDSARLKGSWPNLLQLTPPINPKQMKFGLNLCVGKVGKGEESAKWVIDSAKEVLIQHFSMNEEQAHRFLQNKAMQNRVKRTDYAQFILQNRVF